MLLIKILKMNYYRLRQKNTRTLNIIGKKFFFEFLKIIITGNLFSSNLNYQTYLSSIESASIIYVGLQGS
jgi:hypothetical protein